MGSHGGATVEGQLSILESYGITKEKMGVPVKVTTEVIKLDKLKNGLPVYFNKIANSSDGLIIVNRIKVYCHLRIKSALFFNDLKFKSGLTQNSKKDVI